MDDNGTLIYTKNMQVLWDDLDAYGHVNNARYFTYMQECRVDWLEANGVKVEPLIKAPVVASISCKFIRPLIYPNSIAIDTYFLGRQGKKLLFKQVIRSQEQPAIIFASGEVVIVWLDVITGRSIAEPEEYRYLLPQSE